MNPSCCCTCTDCGCCCWRRAEPSPDGISGSPEDGCITAADYVDVCCGKVFEFTLTITADLRWRPSSTALERRNTVTGSVTVRFTTADTPGFPTLCDNEMLDAEEVSSTLEFRTDVRSGGSFCVPGGLATGLPVPIEYVLAHIGTLKSAWKYPPDCAGTGINTGGMFCAATPLGMMNFLDPLRGYTLEEAGYVCGSNVGVGATIGLVANPTLPFLPIGGDGSCNGEVIDGADSESWASSANVAAGSASWRLRTFHGGGQSEYACDVDVSWSRETVEPCPCGCATNVDPPTVGACCLPSGECVTTTRVICRDLGGDFEPGECATAARCPPPTGACCSAEGGCSVTTRAACDGAGGNYLGDGTSCGDCPAMGACCVPSTGVCGQTTEADCDEAGGVWYEGLECSDPGPVDCGDITGACCKPDGSCVNNTSSECLDLGGFFFEGNECGTVTCPPYGACCCPDGVGGSICVETWGAMCAPPGETDIPCVFHPGGTCPDSCGGAEDAPMAPLMAPPGGGGGGAGDGAPEAGSGMGRTATRPGASRGKGGGVTRKARGCAKCGADKGLF